MKSNSIYQVYRAVLSREMKRFMSSPIYITIAVVLPVLAFALFALVFKNGVPRDLPIAVYNADRTPASRQAVRMLDAAPAIAVTYRVNSLEEGQQLIFDGKCDAVVVIPRDFERNILRGQQAEMVCYVSNMSVLKGGLIDKDVKTVGATMSAGIELQLLQKRGVQYKQATAMLNPIMADRHILFNPYTSYAYYLASSFLPMMLLIFVLIVIIYVIGIEFKEGTSAQWLETANDNILLALMGKLSIYTFLFLILCTLMNAILFNFMGMPLNGSLWMLYLGDVFFILAYEAIAILLMSLLAGLRTALSIGGGYSVLAFTFSGLTFPYQGMDAAMSGMGYAFPFSHYLRIFIDQSLRGAPLRNDWVYFAALAVFILVPLLSLPKLARKAKDPAYWGKQ
jgi:ABC-2 type transport system permease protein